jgi:alpha-tubulin suppressor-like RCC1 family protein
VYAFGQGTFHQLGEGDQNHNEIFAVVIFELLGSRVDKVVAGNRHSMALRPKQNEHDKNNMLVWGNNANGQVRYKIMLKWRNFFY